MRKDIKKNIAKAVIFIMLPLLPLVLLLMMAAGGFMGIMSLKDGIMSSIEDNVIEIDYDNATIDDIIAVCKSDASFEYYFQNCAVTQRQMKRMLKKIKKFNERQISGTSLARSRSTAVTALHEYSLYELVEEDVPETVTDSQGNETTVYVDKYDWVEYSDYDTEIVYSYDSAEIEKLYTIDWQVVYALLVMKASSGNHIWYESSDASDDNGVVAFCIDCGRGLDGEGDCPVCDSNDSEDLENDSRRIENGYCPYCGDILQESYCPTCKNKVETEVRKITNDEIDEILDFFIVDYKYGFDVASKLKSKYTYEQSQELPFIYHCVGDPDTESGRYIWFEPKSLIMRGCNGFLYTYYPIDKDINGNPNVSAAELVNGRDSTMTAYCVGQMNIEIGVQTFFEGVGECFDNPDRYDFNWLMDMVEQLPGGKKVALKYDAYIVNNGTVVSVTEHGKDVYIPNADFFSGIKSKIEAEDDAGIMPDSDIEYNDDIGGTISRYAMSKVGCSYVWGTAGPDTFDCSGLVLWCLNMCALEPPWGNSGSTSRASCYAAGYVKKNKSVSVSNLKQGDIIFFAGEGKSKSVRNVSHVGIYVGDGKFVDARNSKKGVLFGDLTDYWKKRIVVCARPY